MDRVSARVVHSRVQRFPSCINRVLSILSDVRKGPQTFPIDALLGGSSETDGDGSVDDWLAVRDAEVDDFEMHINGQGPILISMHLTGSCDTTERGIVRL